MSAEIVKISTYKSRKRPFTFCEKCPACQRLVEPFVVKGFSTGRYVCEGSIEDGKYHKAVHWNENVDQSLLSF